MWRVPPAVCSLLLKLALTEGRSQLLAATISDKILGDALYYNPSYENFLMFLYIN